MLSAWFSKLGEPVDSDEARLIDAYLRGLGLTGALPIESVDDWGGARNIVTDAAWDRRWWEAEQREKRRLWQAAVERRGEVDVLQSLSRTLETSELVRHAASAAAERCGSADVGLVGAAAAAASEAFHLAELARLAIETEAHSFFLKRALFDAGRWPLGILHGRYRIF
jgi:hypothetical protein